MHVCASNSSWHQSCGQQYVVEHYSYVLASCYINFADLVSLHTTASGYSNSVHVY